MSDLVERLRGLARSEHDDLSIGNEAADEIERLNKCIQWEQNRSERIGTHGPDCHTWGHQHYECLLRECERLTAELALEKQCYADVQAECDHWFKAHEEEQIEHDKTRAERDALKARIEAAEKQEPVGECYDNGTEEGGLRWIPYSGMPRVFIGTKLYTHPAPAAPEIK